MGNIFRNNSFNGVKDTGFLVRAQIGNHIGLQVLADSELLNVKDGVIETEYSSGLICMNNRFVGTGVGSGFTMSADSRPYLQGNSWTSFAKPYSGSVSGQVIAMPVRYLMLTGPDAEVLINNAGTDTLDWTASLEQGSWLRLVEGSGSVEAEKSASPVVIELDPAQPPPVVGSQEILTIKTGSISRNITVVYDPQSGSAAIDQQAYPLGYGDDPFRVEVFDGVTGETRIYNVPQGATEIIIEEWMIGDWSRMRIQRHNGTQWTTVHEEWMGRSSQINR